MRPDPGPIETTGCRQLVQSAFAGKKSTLEEVLDRYRGKGIKILIELKNPSLYPGIEQQVVEALTKRNLDKRKDKVIVQSFDLESVQRFHQLLPTVPIGVLASYGDYKETGVTDEHLRSFAAYADYVNPAKIWWMPIWSNGCTGTG